MWILFLGNVTRQVYTAIVISHWSVVACEDISGVETVFDLVSIAPKI
jgi:hypothetical protein